MLCRLDKCEHYSKATKYPRKCFCEPMCWRGWLDILITPFKERAGHMPQMAKEDKEQYCRGDDYSWYGRYMIPKARERLKIQDGYIIELEGIISETQCTRDFACQKSRFENLPEVEALETRDRVEIVRKHPPCEFSETFEYSSYCRCPVRVFLPQRTAKATSK